MNCSSSGTALRRRSDLYRRPLPAARGDRHAVAADLFRREPRGGAGQRHQQLPRQQRNRCRLRAGNLRPALAYRRGQPPRHRRCALHREQVAIEQLSEADAFGAREQDETFEEPSWELGLEYDAVGRTCFTYLKTRGSFRSGGFNGCRAADRCRRHRWRQQVRFRDDTGRRSRSEISAARWLDRPARLNVAVYNQWIDDVQRVEFPDPDGPGPASRPSR